MVVAVVVGATGWGLLALPTKSAHAAVDYVFNVNCPISHFNSDDPIVFPRQPGVSHRHAFYGNTSTNAQTTTTSLVATKSTCERGFSTADRSAYWVPTLYRKLPDGTRQEIRLSGGDQHLSAYYRRSGGSEGTKVKPFPKGLRMIAGDPFATTPQSTLQVAWRCNGDGGGYVAAIPNCGSGSKLQAIISFPDCWDGRNLDSANHRSHMASSRGDQGICPSSHPVKLPNVTFEITFDFPSIAGSTFELSSGGVYSLHGDFFNAWDDKVQSALVNSCLNAGKYCENVKLSEVDMSAAGPVPRGVEPARPAAPAPAASGAASAAPSAHAGHGASSEPSEAAVLGAAAEQRAAAATTGPSMTWGIVLSAVGALVLGSAFVYWFRRAPDRRRRRGPLEPAVAAPVSGPLSLPLRTSGRPRTSGWSYRPAAEPPYRTGGDGPYPQG
jgi:hypothetical protein